MRVSDELLRRFQRKRKPRHNRTLGRVEFILGHFFIADAVQLA